jgi:hypothetical protein
MVATTNLDVITASKLEYFGSQMWEAMKTWVLTNVDQSDLMTQIKNYLDIANREVIGATGSEKAQAIATSIGAMVQAFTNAGIDMANVKTSQFVQCINSLTSLNGCYIVDTNGLRWTAAEWAYAKEQGGGVDPATCTGVLVDNPVSPFYVATTNYSSQFGTYGHIIPNLEAFTGGNFGTPKDGTYNNRKIMASTYPQRVYSDYKLFYNSDNPPTYEQVDGKDIVFFPNESTMTSWAATMGLDKMSSLGETINYAYPNTGSTASVWQESEYWVLKYCRRGQTSITFAVRENIAPYTDNYGQLGCSALNLCYEHQEYNGDLRRWGVPTIFQLSMIYLNKDAINECRTALGKNLLPTGSAWSCLQLSNNSEYTLDLSSGNSNTNFKVYVYAVVPVASAEQ